MEKKTYIAIIKYDGTNYFGWRRQKDQPQTIQQVIEETLRKMTDLKVNVHAASWTDAGVHAIGQTAALVIRSNINCEAFRQQVNSLLPDDIEIKSITPAPRGFDPIGGNLEKHYRYTISNTDTNNTSWHIGTKLDIKAMQSAADKLVGTHNFVGIKQSKDRRKDCVRTIFQCNISCEKNNIYIDFRGDNFIYLMIRSLTATLVEIGSGRKSTDYIDQLLNAHDNRFCPQPAPPQGLCLMEILY